MVAEISREKSGSGSLKEVKNIYQIIISYKIVYMDDETGKLSNKYLKKWFSTGLLVKGFTQRKAKQMLKTAFDSFDPYKPDIPLNVLLSEDFEQMTTVETTQSTDAEERPISAPIQHESAVQIAGDILFSDYMIQWLEEYKPSVEETTYATYKQLIDAKIVPYFSDKGTYLNQLTAKDLHAFYKHMRLYGASTINRNAKKSQKTSLSAETVRRIHSCIRKALVVASDDEHELLKTNILSMLKRPDKPKNEDFQPQFYSVEEANELLQASKGHPLEIPIKLALFYGLRRGEVLGLRWSSTSFENEGSITINNVYVQCQIYNESGEFGKYADFARPRTKSKSSMRSFIMHEDVKNLLLEHQERIKKQKRKLKNAYNNKQLDYVCVNEMGNVFKPAYVSKNFKKLLDDNNLRPIRFHDLRHTCSAFLLSKGLSLVVVMNHLGHSTYATTERYYGHLDTSAKRQSVKSMAETGLNIYEHIGD